MNGSTPYFGSSLYRGYDTTILDDAAGAFVRQFRAEQNGIEPYAEMRWPRLFPLIKFSSVLYSAVGYGTCMRLSTRAAGGIMQLETAVFTPSSGISIPLLLIDTALTRKKYIVFIEYYDCTAARVPVPVLSQVSEKYRCVPDHREKPAWYIRERCPYSLIKTGTISDTPLLNHMIADSVGAYLGAVSGCAAGDEHVQAENKRGLKNFQDRMIKEGNPSSAVLTKAMGSAEAEKFFRQVIMPVACTEETV